MKILSLKLKDFKGVVDGGVQPRPSGVTVIVGPNEIGKSCLLEGFDLLLNELDSSVRREVRESKPVGRDQGPSVEAEIEAGAYRFTIRKRWLRRPETELRVSRPRAEVKTGREAHDRMREILEASVDIELLGAVRYLQGTTVGPPPLPTRGLLTEALDKATGGASDTDESASLFEAVQEEYRKYFTASGKEVRGTQDLRTQVTALEGRVAELRTEATKAEEEAERHERLSGELLTLSRRLHELEEDQKKWGERLQEVKRLEDRTKLASAELEAAQERHSRAVTAATARSELAHEIEERNHEVEGLRAAYDAEVPELERAEKRHQEAEEDLRSAEHLMEDAEKIATLRKNDHELLRLRFESRLLSERGKRAQRASNDLREAVQALARGGVTDEELESLRGLHTNLTVSQQKLEVASPTLTITALSDFRPVVSGEPISLKKGAVRSVPVPDSVVVEIPTRARLEIKPGISLGRLQDSQRDARSAWDAALAKAEVNNLTEAVESNRSRNEASARKKEAEKALRQALRTDEPEPFANVEELLAKLHELELRIERLERERPTNLALPEKRELAERLAREAQQIFVTAQTRVKTARDAAKRIRDDWGKTQVKEAELRSRRDQAAEMAEIRQKVLKAERERASDRELDEVAEQARGDVEQKREADNAAHAELRKADSEGVRARSQSVDAAVLKARTESGTIQTALTESATRLEITASKGIYDTLGAVQREHDWKTDELSSVEHRASASKLLFEILSLRRIEAQRVYVGPLREQIEQLGRLVHGSTFKVALAEDLSIESRELEGTPIPFNLLSTGAREQLGIIVRLAVAMLVGKDGQGVPVIIDDALGFSDPERLKAMGAVLDQAGKECQILVLTCYPERYGAVGSAEVLRFGA
ncbi:MAG: AAA family ATPase [Thermoplasmata archaeon]